MRAWTKVATDSYAFVVNSHRKGEVTRLAAAWWQADLLCGGGREMFHSLREAKLWVERARGAK